MTRESEIAMALKELKKQKKTLPRNRLLTIRGQILSGDIQGALKGLRKKV